MFDRFFLTVNNSSVNWKRCTEVRYRGAEFATCDNPVSDGSFGLAEILLDYSPLGGALRFESKLDKAVAS